MKPLKLTKTNAVITTKPLPLAVPKKNNVAKLPLKQYSTDSKTGKKFQITP